MRKPILFIFCWLFLCTTAWGQPPSLQPALQLKLDEWHKAGAFPGATLGVVLSNGESFGLAVGFF